MVEELDGYPIIRNCEADVANQSNSGRDSRNKLQFAEASASNRTLKKQPTLNQLAGLLAKNRANAMFKLATKAVKVEINLWALAALLQVLSGLIAS